MKVEASWRTLVDDESVTMSIDSPHDVDTLLAQLSSGTTDASLTHSDRPMIEIDGEQFVDHDLGVGLSHGYGYLVYHDPDHEPAYSVGDPTSPDYLAFYMHAPAGSGVSLKQVRAAVAEFVDTAQRPTAIEWRVDDIDT